MYIECNKKYIKSAFSLTINVLIVKGNRFDPQMVKPVSALTQFVARAFKET